MKAFTKILFYIQLIITGTYRIFRDYVFPVINFLEAIKALLENEELKDTKADESYFAKILGKTEEQIKLFFKAFRKAVFSLLPDLAPPVTSNVNLINKLIEHLRSLTKSHRAMFLFKLASLMLINLYDLEDLKESQSDLLVQMAYNQKKSKKI
jgi:enolase